MPNPISKKQIEEIEARGGKVNLMAKIIAIPGLEAIARHFHDMKHEQAEAHKAAMAAKLEKMDQLIKALESKDLAGAMQRLCEIQNAMLEMKQKHMAEKDDDDDEPCEYLLTFDRDRRGLIDGDKGIRFKPVKSDE